MNSSPINNWKSLVFSLSAYFSRSNLYFLYIYLSLFFGNNFFEKLQMQCPRVNPVRWHAPLLSTSANVRFTFRALERWASLLSPIFFFQAEDGIRDSSVTGVQTCALPIWPPCRHVGFLGRCGQQLVNGGSRQRVSTVNLEGQRCADNGLHCQIYVTAYVIITRIKDKLNTIRFEKSLCSW